MPKVFLNVQLLGIIPNAVRMQMRHGHLGDEYVLKDGKCPRCLTNSAVIFDNKAGNWGSKCLPINLSQINQLSVP